MGETNYFVGVDVGSKSVRAGLFSDRGDLLAYSATPISIHNAKADFYEQNSEEIWTAVCKSVKKVVSGFDNSLVKGIGFDATCSLVVLDENFKPVSVSPDQKDGIYNIIMWMDHRAKKETEEINSKPYKCLEYVGGKISLEMEIPKLLWLKNNFKKSFDSGKHFFDLPDFLTFKATKNISRSLCSLVCKWTYLANGKTQEWDKEFLLNIGLQELLEDNCAKIGNEVYSPGEYIGGLTKEAATSLGLLENTAVGASIIDAHAGALALIFASLEAEENMQKRLGLIGGTSTCHMSLNKKPLFINGVWGPYFNAMVSNYWLSEGGQSATGSLIDHIVFKHDAVKLCPKGEDVYGWLENVLKEMSKKEKIDDIDYLTKHIHVYPDFHGNRSPLADSSFKGMVCGLTIDSGPESLALLYLATLQALAYGTKDILDTLVNSGHEFDIVMMCGGLSNSKIFIQTNADVLGLPVMIPHTKESVLLGASMLGAAAHGTFATRGNVSAAAQAMAGGADTYNPNMQLVHYHKKKYEVFKKMQAHQYEYKKIMQLN